MKIKELSALDVTIIEGQHNYYNHKTKVHKRSFLCGFMNVDTFRRILPQLVRHNIQYLTQSNCHSYTDLASKQVVWLTMIDQKGRTMLSETHDIIHVHDDTLYFVLWKKYFPPRTVIQLPSSDVDDMLLQILKGQPIKRHYIKHLLLYVMAAIGMEC